jgi:hypothetical protein
MWRWTLRILVALSGFFLVVAVCGATWQWLATRKDLASTPPPGRFVDVGGTGDISGVRARARLRSFSRTAWAARSLPGASSSLTSLDSHRSARTTAREWVTACQRSSETA